MLHTVIMAGGIGVRFWPKSRRNKPKQLVDFFGNGVMIKQTDDRVASLAPSERRWIVTSHEQALMIKECMPDFSESQIIIEPMGRNTAPAVGLAAVKLLKHDPDAVMVILPADHLIQDVAQFHACIEKAVRVVSETDTLATIGIEPNRPETGYGYIQIDSSAFPIIEGVFKVKTFAEKPNLQTAKLFLESGEFLWNSGMFIWRADAILKQMQQHMPRWYAGLMEISESFDTPREHEVAKKIFTALKGISIDYGVMEHAPHVAVVKGTFDWSDVGSWDEVWKVLPHDEQGNAVKGNAVIVDSQNNLIQVGDKLVTLVGVNDLIVIETPDAILICPREKSQNVRMLYDVLEQSGKNNYL